MESTVGGLHTRERDILALGSAEVSELLAGKEQEIMRVVSDAYEAHGRGETSLPFSTFLRFQENPANRMIALPARLGGDVNAAGVKWISSFPGNVEHGLDRASAVLILNATATGRPKAILEGSVISAKRTAGSAALAARALQREPICVAGLIGCGPINFEIIRFVQAACPTVSKVLVYDVDHRRARAFWQQCRMRIPTLDVDVASSREDVLRAASLISFATSAGKPYINDLKACRPGSVVLHISLRDLSTGVLLSNDNVVDDADHVCRAQTSLHLAELEVGHRGFIRCTLADILSGRAAARVADDDRLVVFSPFGLGILDVAVGEYVFQQACSQRKGSLIPSFLPASWEQACVAASG